MEITRHFTQSAYVDPDAKCHVTHVDFADGTSWSAPNLIARPGVGRNPDGLHHSRVALGSVYRSSDRYGNRRRPAVDPKATSQFPAVTPRLWRLRTTRRTIPEYCLGRSS